MFCSSFPTRKGRDIKSPQCPGRTVHARRVVPGAVTSAVGVSINRALLYGTDTGEPKAAGRPTHRASSCPSSRDWATLGVTGHRLDAFGDAAHPGPAFRRPPPAGGTLRSSSLAPSLATRRTREAPVSGEKARLCVLVTGPRKFSMRGPLFSRREARRRHSQRLPYLSRSSWCHKEFVLTSPHQHLPRTRPWRNKPVRSDPRLLLHDVDLTTLRRRVCEVELLGNHDFVLRQQKYKVSDALKTGEATTLFGAHGQSEALFSSYSLN